MRQNINTIKFIPLASFVIISDAYAQTSSPTIAGTIAYGPLAQSIPALSDLMLIVLGLLLAVVAFRALRNRSGGQPLASLVALTIASLAMVPGYKFIEEAYAITQIAMTNPAGGTVTISLSGAEVPIQNITTVAQEIKSVTPGAGYSVGTPASSPACTPGLIVQPSSFCYSLFSIFAPA